MAGRTRCEIRDQDVQGVSACKRVVELSWPPKVEGKCLSAYRLHTSFEVKPHAGCRSKRGRPRATPGAGRSFPERAVANSN